MMRGGTLNFALSSDYLNATGILSLLSVLVLVGLFFYLNRYTGRGYFNLWTLGWVFYACWLGLSHWAEPAAAHPFATMLKHWCVGVSAALLFWGSARFLKMPTRPAVFILFMGFLLLWSYIGAYHLTEPLWVQMPIFGTIGLASLVMGFSFYRLRKHREYVGAGLLCFGFVLWGAYLMVSPFFLESRQMAATGFLVAAVLQLFIAVSMIILVLEEARAATDRVLNKVRSYGSEPNEIEGAVLAEELQYQGLFDQSALDQKLKVAYRDLLEAQEAKLQQERLQALSQMSRGMTHDINNALTPILGYTNLILSLHRDLPEGVLKYVRGIRSAGEKISQSIACIRDFYRKGGGTTAITQVDLNQLIPPMIEANRPRWLEGSAANGRVVEIVTAYEADLPRFVAQKGEIRDALNQLIQNALEAMPDGGTLQITTRKRAGAFIQRGQPPADGVSVEVSDTGVGMDADTRKHCIEPFFTTKNEQGAKGLGMSLVFGVAQRHGGRIEIDSEPGEGTIVRLVFPAYKSAVPETATLAPEEPLLALRMLCVDDEPSVLDVVGLLLTSKGHHVETAGHGERGLEIFRKAVANREPFDLVVTDLAMPRMDGRELARVIKQESPQTPIIMITGWGDIMKAEQTQPENIDAVLSKPPDAKELFDTVRKLGSAAHKAKVAAAAAA
jgi:signal transduction histidine kinase/ActR/RegA family two-component response regulator